MNMFKVFVKHDRIYFSVGNQSFQLVYEPEDEPEWSAGQAAEWYMSQLRNALSRLQSNSAAPEIKQEPFGYVREIRPWEWKFSKTTSWGSEVWLPVYRFPPDAQAEIAKRDERITKLEKKAELPMKYKRMQFNAELQREVAEQAAEIARLKGVIAKCKEALEDSHQNINQERGFASEIEHDIEQALAVIKEIENAIPHS